MEADLYSSQLLLKSNLFSSYFLLKLSVLETVGASLKCFQFVTNEWNESPFNLAHLNSGYCTLLLYSTHDLNWFHSGTRMYICM
jgi:hypothetical protein